MTRSLMTKAFHGAVCLVVSLTASVAPAQQPSPAAPAFNCRFVMIPVRDGVRLNTSICEPRGAHPDLPILMTRTPYGIAGDTVV